jgi:hypothetical protein
MSDTLLLRLLGAGQVLKQAIAELKVLRTEDPARSLLPVLRTGDILHFDWDLSSCLKHSPQTASGLWIPPLAAA